MALDWSTALKEINGIDLANYVPQQRSFNSIVFVHKKSLKKPKLAEEKKEKIKSKKDKKSKLDKGQQFNCDKNTETSKDNKTYKIASNNDNSVLEQTIRFAKNIAPLVIPPNEDKSNVFYTIKTSKKHKKKDKKPRESSFNHHESTQVEQEREEPKKIFETYRKVRKESFSVRESVSHSSNNTLDDLNINQSLCCTFSEVSEKKTDHKKEKVRSKTLSQGQKFAISESFEAVATENATGDAKIKIHLMHDKDKHFLSDSIKEPVLNAIRDCISELIVNNKNTEMTTVHKLVKCNSQKLDNIIDKLACIEKKLDKHEQKLIIHENNLNVHENKLHDNENKLVSYEIKLDSYRNKMDSQDKKFDLQENNFKQLKKKLDTHEIKLNTYEIKSNVQIEDMKVHQPKVQESKPKAKASTLEELGADLIEINNEYSSEEELHHELLDRRSRSTVVLELAQENRGEKIENLGNGEVPRSVKGTSTAVKLERPNRIPARFCWTDAARKN